MRVLWSMGVATLFLSACTSSSGSSGGGGDATGGGSVLGVDMSPGKACTEKTGTHCYDGKVVACTLGAWSMVENCAPSACAEKFLGSGACATGSSDASSGDAGASDAK